MENESPSGKAAPDLPLFPIASKVNKNKVSDGNLFASKEIWIRNTFFREGHLA